VTLTTLTMQRAHDEAMGGEPSMPDRPRRRSFTADYKLAVLEEYDRCAGDGDKGALLRREGLYSSHLVEWRRARDSGALAGLGPKDRPTTRNPLASELARTRKRAERAEAELAKTRLVVEIQGKASELLGRLLAESDEENRQQR
jgi:transposase-like protein